jgi:hypothetical protein
MMQRRWKLSPAQRVDLWRRWKAGESLHAIGRALGKQQISGWLKTEYPNEPSLRVSHETIYRSLFIQAHGCPVSIRFLRD